MGSAQIWSTIHQQLRVPDLPLDVSLTDRASCPQQVPLVMRRPVASMSQSMTGTLLKALFTQCKQWLPLVKAYI